MSLKCLCVIKRIDSNMYIYCVLLRLLLLPGVYTTQSICSDGAGKSNENSSYLRKYTPSSLHIGIHTNVVCTTHRLIDDRYFSSKFLTLCCMDCGIRSQMRRRSCLSRCITCIAPNDKFQCLPLCYFVIVCWHFCCTCFGRDEKEY